MEYINKSHFFNYIDCPTLGWLSKRQKLKRDHSVSDDFLFLELKTVRKNALLLFPDGVNARNKETGSYEQNTSTLIQDPQNKTIFESIFTADGFRAHIDIIKRTDDDSAWDLFAVKTGRKSKVKYIWDLAFSSMVLLKAGLQINSASIMLLDKGYRLGMTEAEMFYFAPCTDKVESVVVDFLAIADEAAKVLQSDQMPQPTFRRQCKNCPLFDECIGKDMKNTIFDLPRLSVLATQDLVEKNVYTIPQVPDDFELTDPQKIVRDCVKNNSTYISPNLKSIIESIQAPFYYLDFESITTILPLYPDTAPHTQIVTQFSVHKCDEIDKITAHFQYIADPKINDARKIAQALVDCLGDQGAIITYASFERNALTHFASQFPDLSDQLLQCASRIVDFEDIIRKNYYDIAFKGHSSIKIVLPTLIKDMNYDGLEIGEGGDAAAAFAFMVMGLYDEAQVEQTKQNLLKYCAQDTLAMAKIHKFLFDLVSKLD